MQPDLTHQLGYGKNEVAPPEQPDRRWRRQFEKGQKFSR